MKREALDSTRTQMKKMLGQPRSFIRVVGDVEDRYAQLLPNGCQESTDFKAGVAIKGTEGLVQHHLYCSYELVHVQMVVVLMFMLVPMFVVVFVEPFLDLLDDSLNIVFFLGKCHSRLLFLCQHSYPGYAGSRGLYLIARLRCHADTFIP